MEISSIFSLFFSFFKISFKIKINLYYWCTLRFATFTLMPMNGMNKKRTKSVFNYENVKWLPFSNASRHIITQTIIFMKCYYRLACVCLLNTEWCVYRWEGGVHLSVYHFKRPNGNWLSITDNAYEWKDKKHHLTHIQAWFRLSLISALLCNKQKIKLILKCCYK